MNTTGESNSRGQEAFKYELLLLLVSLIWGSAFAAIAGYLVLNQTLNGRAFIGCFWILLGVLTVQLVPMMGRKA